MSSLRQIIAANVDLVLIVGSWREPHFWPELIDRYLITAQFNHLDTVICINKIDLVEDEIKFQAALKPYADLGYDIILTSARNSEGIHMLEARLRGKTTVLMGLSGVGKSSLIQAVQPNINLRIGDVIAGGVFKGQGSHTTTQSTLLEIDNGSFVIDTPGIRNLGLTGLRQLELAQYYPEMVPFLGNCKYSNCSHIGEPGCAIQAAVAQGKISKIRFKNYSDILETLPK
jgi:ribosome biogenesis GTPase